MAIESTKFQYPKFQTYSLSNGKFLWTQTHPHVNFQHQSLQVPANPFWEKHIIAVDCKFKDLNWGYRSCAMDVVIAKFSPVVEWLSPWDHFLSYKFLSLPCLLYQVLLFPWSSYCIQQIWVTLSVSLVHHQHPYSIHTAKPWGSKFTSHKSILKYLSFNYLIFGIKSRFASEIFATSNRFRQLPRPHWFIIFTSAIAK